MDALGPEPEEKETIFDISTGYLRLLDYRSARELFRPLEKPGNCYNKIRFGNKSFGAEAALVAKRALKGVQKALKDVELTHFYFGRSEAEALKVISIFSSAFKRCVLRSLSLEIAQLGEKGLKAFGTLLKSQNMLEELKFTWTVISLVSAREICEFLPSVEKIKCLRFSDNIVGDDAAEALSALVKKCVALEDFQFSGSWIGTRGAEALVRALSHSGGLKTLDLNHNMFGTIGGVALSQVIPGHLGLGEVFFDNMYLEDEGVIAIADSLKDAAPSLKVLRVKGNYITSKAAPALAECLAVKNLLTIFYAGNNLLRDDGAVVICKAISKGHEQLKELDLSSNGMTVTGAKAAAKAVANKPYFSRLIIGTNFITRNEFETVRRVLRAGNKGDSVPPMLYNNDWKDLGISHSDFEFEEKLIKMKVRRLKKRKMKHDSDSHTQLEKKLHKPKVRYGVNIY